MMINVQLPAKHAQDTLGTFRSTMTKISKWLAIKTIALERLMAGRNPEMMESTKLRVAVDQIRLLQEAINLQELISTLIIILGPFLDR